jgi:peptidoglycan/LPS O-acetylase OafA/YrhL
LREKQAEVTHISPAYSRYLDLLRGLAAVVVVLSHLHLFGIASPQFAGWLPVDGHDAVVLFFILSGFVIAASTQAKESQGLRGYLLDRAARIYSVAVPILILSAALCAIGWIEFDMKYQIKKWWFYIPFHLSFLSQSWGLREIPFGLNPWWSLPFEVWYYIVFGCATFLRGIKRWLICAIVMAIMGPKLWVMLPIWLVGVWLFRSNIAARLTRRAAWVLWLAGPICYLLFMETPAQLWMRDLFLSPFGGWEQHRLGYASYYGRDYVTSLFFVAHLMAAQKLALKLPDWLAKAATALASVSFTLYLLHPIIFRSLSTMVMSPSHNPLVVYGVAALAVALAFLVAPITEGQRRNWRKLFEVGLPK